MDGNHKGCPVLFRWEAPNPVIECSCKCHTGTPKPALKDPTAKEAPAKKERVTTKKVPEPS